MEICNIFQYNKEMTTGPRFRADRFREEVAKLGKPAKLAEELGVSYETLYKTTRGQIDQPSAELVAKVAVLADCSVDYFMGLSNNRKLNTLNLTDMQKSIVELLQRLPIFRQQDILRTAQMYEAANEEDARLYFTQIKDILIRSEREVGGTNIDEYLEGRIKSIFGNNKPSNDQLTQTDSDNQDDNADNTESTPKQHL